MNQYVQKLREKPDNVKKQIALVASLCISGLIFAVWAMTWSFSDISSSKINDDILTPISLIKESAIDTYSQIKITPTLQQTIGNEDTLLLESQIIPNDTTAQQEDSTTIDSVLLDNDSDIVSETQVD